MPRPDTIYRNLIDTLRQSLVRSYRPGETIPSQRALADMFGVGQATVHRALHELASEGLVEARARRGWMRPEAVDAVNRKAATSDKPLRVGIITRRSDPEWTRCGPLYPALIEEAERRGGSAVMFTNRRRHHPTPARNRLDLALVPWNDFDVGLLVEVEDPVTLSDRTFKTHAVMAVDQDAGLFGIDSVSFDDVGVGRMIARHLFELGHRRFAVTDECNGPGWPAEPTWIARRQGFEEMIGRLGGDIRPTWRIGRSRSGNRGRFNDDMEQVAERWASADPEDRPTALFAVDTGPVKPLIDALARRGLSVPRDLSIAIATWYLPGQRMIHKRPEPGDPEYVEWFTRAQLDLSLLVRRTFDVAGERMRNSTDADNNSGALLSTVPAVLVPSESTTTAPRS